MKFSLRTLLVGTTLCAAACALLFGLPNPIAVGLMALPLPWLPIVLISGCIYGRDGCRALFLGATLGASPFLLPLMYYQLMLGVALFATDELSWSELSTAFDQPDSFTVVKFGLAAFYGFLASCGGVALLVRRLVSLSPTPAAVSAPTATPVGPPPPHVALAPAGVSSAADAL